MFIHKYTFFLSNQINKTIPLVLRGRKKSYLKQVHTNIPRASMLSTIKFPLGGWRNFPTFTRDTIKFKPSKFTSIFQQNTTRLRAEISTYCDVLVYFRCFVCMCELKNIFIEPSENYVCEMRPGNFFTRHVLPPVVYFNFVMS